MEFHQFSSLPAELRLQIWETLTREPSMHIFDVCYPSWRGTSRSLKAFEGLDNADEKTRERIKNYEASVFLDCLDASEQECQRATRVARHRFDPSMYRLTAALKAVDRTTGRMTERSASGQAMTTVELPGRSRNVTFPDSDVLMLRFRDSGGAVQAATQVFPPTDAALFQRSSVTEVLEGEWSSEMASTLQGAKKIALDVAEAWLPSLDEGAAFEEVAYLACTLQHDLEVLYLVDNCAGRCASCGKGQLRARDLQTRGELFNGLHYQDGGDTERRRDVIQAVSKRYVEVFDLEGLGWQTDSPAYLFAMMLDEAIRGQQHGEDEGKFQGVRVLVVEEEEVHGRETEMLVDCECEGALDLPPELLEALHALTIPPSPLDGDSGSDPFLASMVPLAL